MITFLTCLLCFFLGSICGNISTTFFYRIPRAIPLNGLEKPPSCAACKGRLRYPYYCPYFAFIFKGGRCYMCGVKIPVIYAFIEFISGILCVLFFLFYPLSPLSLTKFLGLILSCITFLIYFKHGRFYEKMNWFLLTTGLIFNFYCGMGKWEAFLGAKLLMGIGAAIAMFIIKKRSCSIEEICFFVCIALFFESPQIFIISALAALILAKIPKTSSIFILPFLIGMLF